MKEPTSVSTISTTVPTCFAAFGCICAATRSYFVMQRGRALIYPYTYHLFISLTPLCIPNTSLYRSPTTTNFKGMHIVVDIRGEAKFHLCNNDPDDLVYIPPDTGDWRQISSHFLTTWSHPQKPLPTIHHIFYITHHTPTSLAHLSRFSNYSNKVGNTQLLFHGTPRSPTCQLGSTPQSTRLCNQSENCILCLVLRGSYDIEKAKRGGMFGYGIYSTTVSSKADWYASKHRTPSRVIDIRGGGVSSALVQAGLSVGQDK
ncbi:hypothetical protein CC2G_008074 [Coprinopsis cinerea AmutBmut pab1-1]|nr:hypothetical protein CC2G_008074 [Coprinopsis cinerea AmutBmut pab1-1]